MNPTTTPTRTRSGKVTEQLHDGKYDLKLGFEQLVELQESRGVGPHLVMNRLATQAFEVQDITEVIRLGLIGSENMSPKRAFDYVEAHIKGGFLMDYWQSSLNAIFAALHGPEDEPAPMPGEPNPVDQTSQPIHGASLSGADSSELPGQSA